jgi:hypothetical protein
MAGALTVVLLASCATTTQETAPSTPPLDEEQVAALIPTAKVKDRDNRIGWAQDVIAAIRMTKKEPTAERVCAVLAVIEQESGYQVDPPVADLPSIVRKGLETRLKGLGPLAEPALAAILEGKAPNDDKTFGQRLQKLKTERDLDRLFRDVAEAYREQLPGPLSMIAGGAGLEEYNPVTTAGSMQVKVSFAKQLAEGEGLDDTAVRELLYTRGGGIRFGTARLIGYAASYDDIIYRFADYNAGEYASRNAAVQQMLSDLTGMPLATDGDMLSYDKDGDIRDVETQSMQAVAAFMQTEAGGLSAFTWKRDLKKEKSQEFEETDTWKRIRAAWSAKTGKPAPYAQMPDVTLRSPKMTSSRTTSWFATNVKKRYDACRAKAASSAAE